MSENFYFDMNSDVTKKMLSGHIDTTDTSTCARNLETFAVVDLGLFETFNISLFRDFFFIYEDFLT